MPAKQPETQTIIVTGGNGIIGQHVCAKALEDGHNVAAFDMMTDALNDLALKYPDTLLVHQCDLRIKLQIVDGLQKVLKKWGKVDALHNNAAWKGEDIRKFFTSFEEYDLSTWREIMDVNLDGAMMVDQVIGGHMANVQGGGAIVHTASIYGVVAPDPRLYEGSDYLGGPINTPAVYAASKGAIISLTNYLSTYWAGKGVRVNCVTPGGVSSGQNGVFHEKYSAKVPMGRMAEAGEIADGVLYLLSPQASYITGHNLIIDGGFTTW